MSQRLLMVAVFIALGIGASTGAMQNTDYASACSAASTVIKTVTSGAPIVLGWTLTPNTPPTGFSLQIDNGPKVDIGLLAAGEACPSGSFWAGEIPYVYRTPTGFARGGHQAFLFARYNDNGVAKETAAVSVPFDVVDPPVVAPVIHGLRVIR